MAVEKKGQIVAPLRFEEPGVQLATLSNLATTIATQQQLVAIEKKLDDIKTDLEYLIDSQHAEVEARVTVALHVLDDVYSEMTKQGRFDDDQWQRIIPLEQVIRELHARCLVHLRAIDHAMEQPSGNVGERVKVLNKAVRDAHVDVWLPMYFHAERALTQWEILWVLRQIDTQPDRARVLSGEVAATVSQRHWDMVSFADGIAAFLKANASGGSKFDALRLISRTRLRRLILHLDSVQRDFRDSLTSLASTQPSLPSCSPTRGTSWRAACGPYLLARSTPPVMCSLEGSTSDDRRFSLSSREEAAHSTRSTLLLFISPTTQRRLRIRRNAPTTGSTISLKRFSPTTQPSITGNQYLTAYEIALELENRHPTVVDRLAMPRGGLDNRENTGLPQYIERMLSQRVLREGHACPIEGGFLSPALIDRLEMSSRRGSVVSSVTGGDGISVFRVR